MRVRGGILDVSDPLPDGWENGVTFLSAACTEPQIIEVCTIVDPVTEGVRPSGPNTFVPVFVRQTAACSRLTNIGTRSLAQERLEGTTEWALGRLLQTGSGGTNPTLEEGEVVHVINAPTDDLILQIVDLVSCLEQAVANTGYGGGAFLHAPPRAAAYLRSASLVSDDGLSPMGLPWVFSSGYTPEDTGGGTEISIWATGSLWAAEGANEPLIDPTTGRPPAGWRTNSDETIAQRMALAAFDPCLNLTAKMTVPLCIGES
jgi:hypothetical protein